MTLRSPIGTDFYSPLASEPEMETHGQGREGLQQHGRPITRSMARLNQISPHGIPFQDEAASNVHFQHQEQANSVGHVGPQLPISPTNHQGPATPHADPAIIASRMQGEPNEESGSTVFSQFVEAVKNTREGLEQAMRLERRLSKDLSPGLRAELSVPFRSNFTNVGAGLNRLPGPGGGRYLVP